MLSHGVSKKLIRSDRTFQTHSICQLNFTCHHFNSADTLQWLIVFGEAEERPKNHKKHRREDTFLLLNVNFESLNTKYDLKPTCHVPLG